MIKKFITSQNILLLSILIVASFMRLYKIADYLTFLGDEGRDVLVVYNILHGHFTLLGPTSSVGGFFLGPIYYYLMAPALFLANYSPVGPAVMIAVLGVITVWLVYYVASLFFNKTGGLIAALLFAINPLVILYSRSSWNPNPMPLVTLLMLFLLYRAVEKHSLKLYLFTGILYGIAMQLHYIEVFVGPIMALYFLIGNIYSPVNKKINFNIVSLTKEAVVTLLGFIIGWSPFLTFEARHGFNNLRAIFNFVFHPTATGNGVGIGNDFFTITTNIFPRVFGRLILYIPSPDLYPNFPSWQIQLWMTAAWIIGIASFAYALYSLWKSKTKTKFLQYLLLILWFGLGLIFFGFYKKNIYDYYFEFLFPVPFILVGGLFAMLYSRATIVKIIISLSLLVIIFLNLQGVPFRYPGNQQLKQTETIAKFVLDKANNQPFNFALITAGNSDHAYRYFFTIWDRNPITIQYPGIDPQRKSITNQLLIVCEEIPCMPLGNSLWEIAGFGRGEIAGHWNVSVVEVYKIVHYKGK